MVSKILFLSLKYLGWPRSQLPTDNIQLLQVTTMETTYENFKCIYSLISSEMIFTSLYILINSISESNCANFRCMELWCCAVGGCGAEGAVHCNFHCGL